VSDNLGGLTNLTATVRVTPLYLPSNNSLSADQIIAKMREVMTNATSNPTKNIDVSTILALVSESRNT